MSVIWNKVWLDLWQSKVRTLLAVLSIAAGVFAIGATFGMADQMLSGMDAAHQATYPSHIQLFTSGVNENMVSTFKKIDGVEGLDLANFRTIRYKVHAEDEWENGWLIMREDYEAPTYDRYELKDGVWPKNKGLAVERLSSQHYELDHGDEVTFEVMRAIGAGTNTMMGMFITEGILQGIFSWVIVVPLSVLIGRPMANILGQTMFSANLDYQYNLQGTIIWFAIVLTISTIASFVPARHASSISVRESLAYA